MVSRRWCWRSSSSLERSSLYLVSSLRVGKPLYIDMQLDNIIAVGWLGIKSIN